MNTSGDAAEQIVRMSLEGTEVALRLSGAAAKNIAAMLYAALKNTEKTKHGRQRLASMMKSGKQLKVFTVRRDHLKLFAKEAKRYGVVYCALRGKEADGMVDILVCAEDAPKINRIVERFKLTTVDAATVENEKITEIPVRQKEEHRANPQKAQAEKSGPSAPTSTMQRERGTTFEKRPSVREAIRELRESREKTSAQEVAKEIAERIPAPKISANPRER